MRSWPWTGHKIINLRKVYGGAQTAIVLLSRQAARRLCADGRIWIGLVYARVKPTEPLNRCFRCLVPGYMSRTCTGVDRSAYCWRSSELGHRISGCMATVQAANVFREDRWRESFGSHRIRETSRKPRVWIVAERGATLACD